MRVHSKYNLLKDNRGAVFALIAMSVIMMAGLCGAALDYSRYVLLRTELSSALDSAALAGGTVVNSPNRDAIIQRYFNANFPAGYMGSTVSPLSIVADIPNNKLTVTANATLNYSLMKVVKKNGIMSTSATTEVTLEKRGMEIALVMDNTGSMNGANFQAMRSAALRLIDILYGNNETVPNLYVSLIPYTASVNIGTGNVAWTSGVTASNYSPTTWKGCVATRARSNGTNNEMSEDFPTATSGFWQPYLYPSQGENNDLDSDQDSGGNPDNCWKGDGQNGCSNGIYTATSSGRAPSTSGSGFSTQTGSVNGSINSTFTVTNTSSFKINPNEAAGNHGRGPNLGCGAPITPLIQSKTSIRAAINTMDSWHRGGTLSDVGLAWGWRTLSENWTNRWAGGASGHPIAYNTPLMDKVIIILTDGENSIYQNNYSAYGRVRNPTNSSQSGNIFNTTNSSTVTNNINTRLTNLCTTIKQKGIIIYSITYTGSANTTIQGLFRGCASNEAYYFNAPDSTTISTVFQQIGDSLNNLRISR